ncbi:hypothetical protein ID866_10036 [Astraeus odoratus]|nr:hypothetical protein ID866_10036 [Astraeus odoratus]
MYSFIPSWSSLCCFLTLHTFSKYQDSFLQGREGDKDKNIVWTEVHRGVEI